MQEFSGKVLHGKGYGQIIGFPTANIKIENQELPKGGVYSGRVIFEDKEYKAGIVVGPGEQIEAHLLNFEGDLYDKEITILIQKFLREFKNFDTEEELKAQIAEDLKNCK